MPLMDFDPQRKGPFVSGSGRLCQISSKLVQNCDRESTDTQTDRQTDTYTHTDHTSDLIICPMLCYSNGTDKNLYECKGYNAWQFITEFPYEGWTKNASAVCW